MELVVDANILVAGFLRSAVTRELLLDERLTLYTPEYSLTETERVLTTSRFRRKLRDLSAMDVRSILAQLTGKVRVLSANMYEHQLAKARQLTPDAEDAPYLAVALHLRLPLWSNDSILKKQRVVRIYSTQELLELL